MKLNCCPLDDYVYEPSFPNMEIKSVVSRTNEKREAISKFVDYAIETFADNQLTLHEIKGTMDLASDTDNPLINVLITTSTHSLPSFMRIASKI